MFPQKDDRYEAILKILRALKTARRFGDGEYFAHDSNVKVSVNSVNSKSSESSIEIINDDVTHVIKLGIDCTISYSLLCDGKKSTSINDIDQLSVGRLKEFAEICEKSVCKLIGIAMFCGC